MATLDPTPLNNQEVDKMDEKNSCWNLQDPEWIKSAYKFSFSDSIYVHYDLLVWLVNFIHEEILQTDWNLRCTVEEIYHHSFEGQVYCIRFYRRLARNSIQGVLNRSYYVKLGYVIENLKYKMVWKSKPTYFLRIDSNIIEKRKILRYNLQRFNILQLIENTNKMHVNWMYIENVEIFEFAAQTTKEQISLIDNSFLRIKSETSLYITKEFVWHKLQGEFIDVDTLAMDICAEEWRHNDLFQDFSIEEVLHVDLANKDYRDSYYNGYLDGYIKILLSKWYPDLLTDNQFQYLLPERNNILVHYFINQFRYQISSLYAVYTNEAKYYENYDIPLKIPSSKEISLTGLDPDPDTLKNLLPQYGVIHFSLTNYAHFTHSIFCFLLNHPSLEQAYLINFEKEFTFQTPANILPIQINIFPMERRSIVIRIQNCNNRNVLKLEHFLEYLKKLFNDAAMQKNILLSITFDDCDCLKDCSVIGSLSTVFQSISLAYSNFSAAQLNTLSGSLTERSKIRFNNCDELNDQIVFKFVSNSAIEIENLYIEGSNLCTPLLFFQLAEHLLEKEKNKGINTINGARFRHCGGFLPNDKFKSILPSLTFFRADDSIQIRSRFAKSSEFVLDPYYLINGLPQDEPPPFDYD